MFYLYVKIYSRSQLMQLEPAITEGLTSQITRINRKFGGRPEAGLEGGYRYAALYRETLINTIDAAEACRDLLEENKDSLDGYNIILTKTDKRDYELQKSLDFLVFQLLDDGGVWIDPGCFKELEDFLVMKKESFLYQMESRKKHDLTSLERLSVILESAPRQEKIIRWLEGEGKQALVLSGREGSGRRRNLSSGLEKYFGSEKPSALFLKLKGTKDYLYDPFMDCLFKDRVLPEEAAESSFLRDLLEGKMMSRCSDFFSDDFEVAFLAFLDRQYRKARARSRNLIIVVEKGEKFSPFSKRLLKKILRDDRYRFILISDRDTAGDLLEDRPCEEINFPLPSSHFLEKRLKEAYPGMEWTPGRLDIIGNAVPYNLKSVFFTSWLISHGVEPKGEVDPLEQMIDSLDKREVRVLHYIHLAKGLVTRDELSGYLADQNEDASLISERVDRLKALTFVVETEKGELYSNLSSWNRDGENRSRIIKNLLALLKSKEGLNPFRYFDLLEEYGEVQEALAYLNEIMNWLINNGFRDMAENIISHPPFYGKDLDGISLEGLKNLLFASRLRLAMLEGRGEQLDGLVANGLLSQVSERGRFADEFFLQMARYYFCQGNMEQTVNYAKNSLFTFQKTGHHLGESLANIELAFAFLGQRKVQMGIDYFEIARRISYQIEDNYTLITAHTFGALTAYLFGNMSKAENIIEQTLDLAGQNGSRRRIFFLTFLAGRIKFEYGRYREGAELFEKCYNLSGRIGMEDGMKTARRWVGRCLLYEEKRRDAFRWIDSEDGTREGLFFLAEADFMVSLYESALRKLEQAEALPPETAPQLFGEGYLVRRLYAR